MAPPFRVRPVRAVDPRLTDPRTPADELPLIELATRPERPVVATVEAPASRVRPALSPAGHLTDRQVEIFWHAAQGLSQSEIATALGISLQTVKNHVSDAYMRLDVHTVPEVLTALGWLRLPGTPAVEIRLAEAYEALARIRTVLEGIGA